MRLIKFVHSCLLVETPELTVITDPGSFSWDSHLFHPKAIDKLDYIVVTHEHADHYSEPFLRSLSEKFPHATIATNNDLAEKIAALSLPNPITTGSDDNLTLFEAKHEPLPLGLPNVLNIGFHLHDKLTHPGDSYDFKHTREVLAIPITAPFGSLKDSLKAVAALKPKVVVPIHDWEWHAAARQARYKMCKDLLAKHDIKFVELENAKPLEL